MTEQLQRRAGTRRAIVLSALLLGGCSLGASGQGLTNNALGGRDQPSPSVEGRSWDCATLARALDQDIKLMAQLQPKIAKELSETPPTLERLFARTFGGGPTVAGQEFNKNHAEAERYNALLRGKGCAVVDIDAAVARSAAASPQAEPEKPKPAPIKRKRGND